MATFFIHLCSAAEVCGELVDKLSLFAAHTVELVNPVLEVVGLFGFGHQLSQGGVDRPCEERLPLGKVFDKVRVLGWPVDPVGHVRVLNLQGHGHAAIPFKLGALLIAFKTDALAWKE